MAVILIWAQMDLPLEHAHAIIDEAKPLIEAALEEPGCEIYTWSHDPYVPGRVNVFERWTSEEELAAHFLNPAYTDMGKQLRSRGPIVAQSRKFRVDVHGPIYDENRVPSAEFFDVVS